MMIRTTTITTMDTTTTDLEIDSRCKPCFLSTYKRLFDKFQISLEHRERFLFFFDETLSRYRQLSTPQLQRILNLELSRILGVDDLFVEEKKQSNDKALSLYNQWKDKLAHRSKPLHDALRLSIAGNIMDYGANNAFDLDSTIESVMISNFAIDHSNELFTGLKKAKSVLYLADNAGEIVFDKLFIEMLNHPNITVAVRGGNALNDATLSDAHYVGLDQVAQVISNGFDAPSTVLEKSSSSFKEKYYDAELIISKGQGNLEGLIHQHDSRIFFLLMVKCDVISQVLKVPKGSFVVYKSV